MRNHCQKHALDGRLAQQVAKHAVPQFGFKPSAFGRQDAALIGDGHQVGNAQGRQGKSDAVSGFIRQFFQFLGSPNAADKGNAPAVSGIFHGQQGSQHLALKERGVQKIGGILGWRSFWAELDSMPTSGKIHSPLMLGFGLNGNR